MHHPNTERKLERQRVFIGKVAEGLSIAETCRVLGMHRQVYERWRRNDQDFRFTIDQLRSQDPHEGYNGSFISFRKEFFGYDTFLHQREIIRAIESAQPGEIVLVLVPPEHGKTTVVEDWCCMKLGQDPNFRILYGSEGQGHTRKICGRIRKRMVDPKSSPEYVMRFGPFYVDGQERRGKPWGADYFTVWQADHDERDYSFESKGWSSAVAGTRTDLLILDDIQSSRSIGLTDKMLDTLQQDWFTRPGKDGAIVIVGTRVGVGDIYQTMIEAGLISRLVVLPAMDEAGNPLCPEMWPKEDLERKRKIVGEAVWWRNYMQQPRHAIDATFSQEVIDGCANLARTIGQIPTNSVDKIMMLDPAIVGGNALVAASVSALTFDVLDYQLKRNIGSAERILAGIEEFAVKYKPSTLIIEDNAYQKALKEDERLKLLARSYGFKIVAHTTGRNKLDEAMGVARMAMGFIAGEISYPYADEATKMVMDVFREEFLNWQPDANPRKHRMDLVMATWFGWLWWEKKRKHMGEGHTSTIIRSGLPWAPTSLSRSRVA